MFFELKSSGLFAEKQKQIKVYYENQQVGEYYADLIVSKSVIVE
jgi:GxxExxY protein